MAHKPTRRVFLQSAAVGIAGLSGCTMLEGQSSSQIPEFVGLSALNYHDAPHTVHVRLGLDGETVYRESKQTAASELEDTKGAVFSDHPTAVEPYVLSAWRDDRPEADAGTLEFASFDTECLGITLKIGNYGRNMENPILAIYFSTNCRF